MSLEALVESRIAGRPDAAELLALWRRARAAYERGGRKGVEALLVELGDAVALDEPHG